MVQTSWADSCLSVLSKGDTFPSFSPCFFHSAANLDRQKAFWGVPSGFGSFLGLFFRWYHCHFWKQLLPEQQNRAKANLVFWEGIQDTPAMQLSGLLCWVLESGSQKTWLLSSFLNELLFYLCWGQKSQKQYVLHLQVNLHAL